MNIWGLLRNILPFVLPYKWLIVVTLVLTLIGSLMAQVNAVVLDRAVDAINAMMQQPDGFHWSQAVKLLTIISIILLGKEVIGAVVTFCQRYYGERMRILVSRDMSLKVVDRILSFRMAFFNSEGNETGKLQSRIDRGIMSMSNTVNNFFIEILPLFTSAILALCLISAYQNKIHAGQDAEAPVSAELRFQLIPQIGGPIVQKFGRPAPRQGVFQIHIGTRQSIQAFHPGHAFYLQLIDFLYQLLFKCLKLAVVA